MIELKVRHSANSIYFALYVDGERAGGCEVNPFEDKMGKGILIENLTIFEDYRRKGYAKHLLKCLDDHELTGDKFKTLLVYSYNEVAINLYASAGYARTGFLPAGIIAESQAEMCVMSKHVTAVTAKREQEVLRSSATFIPCPIDLNQNPAAVFDLVDNQIVLIDGQEFEFELMGDKGNCFFTRCDSDIRYDERPNSGNYWDNIFHIRFIDNYNTASGTRQEFFEALSKRRYRVG